LTDRVYFGIFRIWRGVMDIALLYKMQYVAEHHGKERQAKMAEHLGVPLHWLRNAVRTLRNAGILPERVTWAEAIRSIKSELKSESELVFEGGGI
jgi:DNA-binding Lrp family transcriptional regulator